MLNFKNEYYLLEKGRVLYPTAFKDKSSIEVYGAKVGGVTGTEDTAHVFKVPSNHYSLNAGNIDFSSYPNGIDKDFKSIKIVNVENLISLPVNFNEFKDITPENLKMSFELLGNSLKDVQKRLSEVGLYIDSNLPGEIGLPKLPIGCTWYCNQDGHITAIPISDIYEKFQQMIDNLYTIIKERLDKDYENFSSELRELTDNLLKELSNLKDKCLADIKKKGDEQLARLEKAVDEIADQQFSTKLQPNTTIINLPDTWVLSSYRTKLFIDGILMPYDSYTISGRKITLKQSYPYTTDIFINDTLPIGYVQDAEKHLQELVANWKKDINSTGDLNVTKVNNSANEKITESLKKILAQETESLKKFSLAESNALSSIQNKSDEEIKKLEDLGNDIETQLSILLEQADLANIKTLIGNNYQGIFDHNIKYYPGDIYYKKDSAVIGLGIPNNSNPGITKTSKLENIKKFYRLYGGMESEFNFAGNGDNEVVGIAIKDSNKLIRTNSCVEFELNVIDYTVALDIPNTNTPALTKIMTANQDDSSTTITKKQTDLPLWSHTSQSEPTLRKFNY